MGHYASEMADPLDGVQVLQNRPGPVDPVSGSLHVESDPYAVGLKLDPKDPFESALIGMVETNRKKRKDYALDDDIFSNFDATSVFAGFQNRWMSALFNCSQKLARVTSLRANGRLGDVQNEAVEDTLLDNAVYAVIALAIYRQDIEEAMP